MEAAGVRSTPPPQSHWLWLRRVPPAIDVSQSPASRSRLLVVSRLALSSYWLSPEPASSPALLGAVDRSDSDYWLCLRSVFQRAGRVGQRSGVTEGLGQG